MAPIEENNQPNKLMDPNAASAAGSKNTPDPIILPATSEVLDQNPILVSLISKGSSKCCEIKWVFNVC
jgi:hypothetical protein